MSLEDVELAIRQVMVHVDAYRLPDTKLRVNRAAPANNWELSTRYMVIDPVLRSLGWDLSDPSHCMVESPAGQAAGPQARCPRVDYSLRCGGREVVLVEAKRVAVSLREVFCQGWQCFEM